jgi:hypothetical protein
MCDLINEELAKLSIDDIQAFLDDIANENVQIKEKLKKYTIDRNKNKKRILIDSPLRGDIDVKTNGSIENVLSLNVPNAIDYEDLPKEKTINETAEDILTIIFDVLKEHQKTDRNVIEFTFNEDFSEEVKDLNTNEYEAVLQKCLKFLELYGYNCSIKGVNPILRITL